MNEELDILQPDDSASPSVETVPPDDAPVEEGMAPDEGVSEPQEPAESPSIKKGSDEHWFVVVMENIERRILEPGKKRDRLLERMDGAQNLAQEIGDIAFELVVEQIRSLTQAERLKDFKKHKGIMLEIGAETVNTLTQMAVSAGVWDFADENEEQQMQGEALMRAAEHYGDYAVRTGISTKEEIESMLVDINAGKYDPDPKEEGEPAVREDGRDMRRVKMDVGMV
jgi:hypothetical protein